MAEVRKNKKIEKYDITDKLDSKDEKKKEKKEVKKDNKKDEKKDTNNKKNLWVRFRIFCHGVGSEFKKVHWPTKNDMIKYSIATIVFVVFLALFFYLIDVLFALLLDLI